MPAGSRQYRQVARQALLQRQGATPSHKQLADRFKILRERLAHTLSPVFGATAVDALFERSRHLTADEFPWVPAVLPQDQASLDLSKLPRVKATEGTADGFAAVLAYDIGLLAALVGIDLIWPLVEKAWGPIGHRPNGAKSDEA